MFLFFLTWHILFDIKKKIKRMKRQGTDLEKILAKSTSDKELSSKMDKEFLKFNNKNTNSLTN